MAISTQVRYRRTLAFLPQFGNMYFGPINAFKRSRESLRPYWDWNHLGDDEPVEYLWERATFLVEELWGDVHSLRAIRGILREAATLRESVFGFLKRKRSDDHPPLPHEVEIAVELSTLRLGFCKPTHCLDAHLEFLSDLWSKIAIRDFRGDWEFNIPITDRRKFLSLHYAMASLQYAELTKLAIGASSPNAVNYALRGERALRLAVEYSGKQFEELARKVTSERARKAAKKKYQNDPKQDAKRRVYDRWLNWMANREKHKNFTKFALKMQDDYPILESTDVIIKWVREWRRGQGIPIVD